MISVNKDKCIGCGECTKVCAGLVLKMEDGLPVCAPRGCIFCGHCEAICPTQAISMEGDFISPAPATDLEKQIMYRRSIRRYKADTPDKQLIQEALDLAQWSANSKNQRKNGWSVVLGKDKIDALLNACMDWCRENKVNRALVRSVECGINLITCGAPCLIFSWIDESAINHELDCAIASTTAELLLRQRGIATCWGGFITRLVNASPELLAMAGIPEGVRLCCTLMAGIPDEEYPAIPRRPKANIVWTE